MDAIIFTEDQFTDLMTKLYTIQSQLSIKADPKEETFLDYQEFLLLIKAPNVQLKPRETRVKFHSRDDSMINYSGTCEFMLDSKIGENRQIKYH